MPLLDINQAVKDKISGSNDAVKEAVITGLAKKETDRRTDALIKGIEKAGELQKEIYKIKPDVITYTDPADQNTKQSAYSAKAAEDLKKANEKLTKLSKAIDKAETGDFGDFGDLYGVLQDKGGGKDAAPATE